MDVPYKRPGVRVTRVQQLISAGRLPAQKTGRGCFIKEVDLRLVAGRKSGRPPKAKTAKVLRADGA